MNRDASPKRKFKITRTAAQLNSLQCDEKYTFTITEPDGESFEFTHDIVDQMVTEESRRKVIQQFHRRFNPGFTNPNRQIQRIERDYAQTRDAVRLKHELELDGQHRKHRAELEELEKKHVQEKSKLLTQHENEKIYFAEREKNEIAPLKQKLALYQTEVSQVLTILQSVPHRETPLMNDGWNLLCHCGESRPVESGEVNCFHLRLYCYQEQARRKTTYPLPPIDLTNKFDDILLQQIDSAPEVVRLLYTGVAMALHGTDGWPIDSNKEWTHCFNLAIAHDKDAIELVSLSEHAFIGALNALERLYPTSERLLQETLHGGPLEEKTFARVCAFFNCIKQKLG